MRTTLILCLLALGSGIGCGGDDTTTTADAPNVPAMITITGTASERSASGSNPKAGVMVAAYKNSDAATVVAMSTTDAAGMYTLTIPTGGAPIDGYVKATVTGLVDTYLYPPKPLIADFSGASLNMITQGTLDLLSGTLCGSGQEATKGVIAVLIVDAAMTPIEGATATGTPAPAKICYNGSSGLPDRNATVTQPDGVAYMLNVGPGEVTVNASKSGLTFVSHKVNARAGVFTTTPISP
ncbi:MAG TPA: hypothetical protein VIV11_17660 [Kofleriaceae bacterium]